MVHKSASPILLLVREPRSSSVAFVGIDDDEMDQIVQLVLANRRGHCDRSICSPSSSSTGIADHGTAHGLTVTYWGPGRVLRDSGNGEVVQQRQVVVQQVGPQWMVRDHGPYRQPVAAVRARL